MSKFKNYIDKLYNWQNAKFEDYVKYMLKNPYGSIINSISLLSINYIGTCVDNFRKKENIDYDNLTSVQKMIVDYISKSSEKKILSMDFIKKVYVEYSKFCAYKLNLSLNTGISDLVHEKYLNKESSHVQNVEAIQTLYYYCFYAFLTYENNNTINSLLPRPNTESDIIENYIHHFNNNVNAVNSIFNPKFFIYLDHLGLNIIIAIRGLSTTADTISFIVGDMEYPYCLGRFSKESNYLAHKGFTTAACNVLETAMPLLKKWVSMYPDYNIKVVGHSYGAGVAAIVAWALNQDFLTGELKTNTSVRGILFGCPPIFNEEAVNDTCSFLLSVIFGWDIIPCFSASNIFKFSCDIVSGTRCYDQTQNKTLFCDTYVPGTIYWLTYNEITLESHSLNLIFKDNDRLQNIILHERMDDDQNIKLMYTYLLSLILKQV